MELKRNKRSTWNILKTLLSKKSPPLYQRLSGVPEFDPEKHSDGCSGGMSLLYTMAPDKVKDKHGLFLPWRSCCEGHDRAYYYGGTAEEKRIADEKLMACVSEKFGDSTKGRLLGKGMEMAVKLGGKPYYPTSYRWGYGEDFRETTGDSDDE